MQKVEDILHIKEAFSILLADEVGRIIKVKNSSKEQKKPRINMTMKGLSRKQVIISTTKLNAELIVNSANQIIANINKGLKEIKSEIFANFIYIINKGVIITTNKLASTSNLIIIKKYIKNSNNINLNAINSSHFPKSKSYLKIIGLLYIREISPISSNIIKGVFKETYVQQYYFGI